MKNFIRQHHISVKIAWSGLRWALSTQPNFRIHLTLATVALLAGWYVKLTSVEWLILVFTIFWGLSGEMINTAIESLTDLVSPQWSKEAKIAKDVAAGMMLTIAFGSAIVGVLLLIPKLLLRLGIIRIV